MTDPRTATPDRLAEVMPAHEAILVMAKAIVHARPKFTVSQAMKEAAGRLHLGPRDIALARLSLASGDTSRKGPGALEALRVALGGAVLAEGI